MRARGGVLMRSDGSAAQSPPTSANPVKNTPQTTFPKAWQTHFSAVPITPTLANFRARSQKTKNAKGTPQAKTKTIAEKTARKETISTKTKTDPKQRNNYKIPTDFPAAKTAKITSKSPKIRI